MSQTDVIPLAETPVNPEATVHFQDTFDLTATLGNHELKALTLALLGFQNTYLNSTGMGHMLNGALKEAGAEWIPNPRAAISYCQNTFETIGQVVKGDVPGIRGPSEAYVISERGWEVGVPFAGLILDWSLRYPDISVQSIFGPTNSKGETRAPQHRAEVLLQLVTHPHAESGLSTVEMAEIDEDSWDTNDYHARLCALDLAARRLEKAGIVRVERVTVDNDRVYTIIDPDPPQKKQNMHPVTVELYAFMKERSRTGDTAFTYNECLEEVTERVLAKQPHYDPADIRDRLTTLIAGNSGDLDQGGVGKKPIPGLERSATFNDGAHTRTLLLPEHAEAVRALIDILMAVEYKDEAMLTYGIQRAREIMAAPKEIKVIADKAYKFSPGANKLPREVTQSQLISILQSRGEPLNSGELLSAYEDTFGRELSKASVQAIMAGLVDTGDIEVSSRRSDGSLRKEVNYYGLVSSTEA